MLRLPLLVPLLLALPASAAAQGIPGSIQDSNVIYAVTSFPTSATSSGGAQDLRVTGASGQDHLVQAWWYYRINSEARESAFNNGGTQLVTGYGGNEAQLRWDNVDGKGFAARLDILVYSTGGSSGVCVQAMTITNNTAAPLTLSLYAYADLDACGAVANSAAFVTPATQQEVRDPSCPVRCYFLGCGNDRYETANHPAVRDQLLDGAITDFSNSGIPYGPGNWSSAYQWKDRVLLPGRAFTATAVLACDFRLLCCDVARARPFCRANAGTNGQPKWDLEPPYLGSTLRLTIFDGAIGAVPILFLGIGQAEIPVSPFTLCLSAFVVQFLGNGFATGNVSSTPLAIPADASLCGAEFVLQGFWLDARAAGGLAHTDGLLLAAGGANAGMALTVTVSVNQTKWVSLGGSTSCKFATSADPQIATSDCDNGPFRGGFNVTGVKVGATTINLDYSDNKGNNLKGTCTVTVVP